MISMIRVFLLASLLAWSVCADDAAAQPGQEAAETRKPTFDAALAEQLGADDYGMRSYVLVILRTGPEPVPEGPARKAMFAGHFANMKRLAEQGTLVLAGPLDGVDGWRGLFVLAVDDIDAARAVVETDPVVAQGEMVPEFHTWYGSAGLMTLRDLHARIAKKEI